MDDSQDRCLTEIPLSGTHPVLTKKTATSSSDYTRSAPVSRRGRRRDMALWSQCPKLLSLVEWPYVHSHECPAAPRRGRGASWRASLAAVQAGRRDGGRKEFMASDMLRPLRRTRTGRPRRGLRMDGFLATLDAPMDEAQEQLSVPRRTPSMSRPPSEPAPGPATEAGPLLAAAVRS